MPRISRDNRVTLPRECLAEAGLRAGDEVVVEATGPGTVVVRRARRIDAAIGVFHGLYPPGYLDRLRAEDDLT